MEKVKLDNKRILFNLLPAHVAQHFLMSNPRNMVSIRERAQARFTGIIKQNSFLFDTHENLKNLVLEVFLQEKKRI